jgi:hypothetical protein
VQQILECLPIGTMPLQLPPIGPGVRPNRQANPVMDQVAQQAVQSPLAIELVEDQVHHLLRLLVGVESQPHSGLPHIADRRVMEQLATAGLVQSPLVHPGAEEVQLGLAHDAFETQEQPVVEVGRVVQPIVVAQERPEQAAGADQGDPVRIGASQATGVLSQKYADMIKTEFREDVLEAAATLDRLGRAPLVGVDDLDAVGGGGGDLKSGVLMFGLLPRRVREALGDDLTEHEQDFLTPRWGEARPGARQRPATSRGLEARGGTGERCEWDMVALRATRRAGTDTTAPTAAARSR